MKHVQPFFTVRFVSEPEVGSMLIHASVKTLEWQPDGFQPTSVNMRGTHTHTQASICLSLTHTSQWLHAPLSQVFDKADHQLSSSVLPSGALKEAPQTIILHRQLNHRSPPNR